MTKTSTKHRELVSLRLTPENSEVLERVKLPHVNKSSLINRALDFGLEKAIREMLRSVEPAVRN